MILGVFGINTSSNISKLSQISLAEAARDILGQYNLKYYSRYLSQIPLETIVLPILIIIIHI